jgi:hypothetical protein
MTQKNRVCPICKTVCRKLQYQNPVTYTIDAFFCVECKSIYSTTIDLVEVKEGFFLSRSRRGEQSLESKKAWILQYQSLRRLKKNKKLIDFVEDYLKKNKVKRFTVRSITNAFAEHNIIYSNELEFRQKKKTYGCILGRYVCSWIKYGMIIKYSFNSRELTEKFWDLWPLFKQGRLRYPK